MRRLLLVFLMMLLPFQWSWAAAASVCQHEQDRGQASHFGHHEHQHAGEPGAVDGDFDGDGVASPMELHPDCHVCHGLGLASMSTPGDGGPGHAVPAATFPYLRHLPDPPLAGMLRPPMSFVA